MTLAMKTVREILTLDWLAAGHAGEPTREYIRAWRETHPEYGKWPLGTRFYSGSLVGVRPDQPVEDPDEEATELPSAKEQRAKWKADLAPFMEEARRWRQGRNREEQARGSPMPFPQDGTG